MKKWINFVLLFILFACSSLHGLAAVLPNDTVVHPMHTTSTDLRHMKLKDFQHMSGRRLTFKEKIAFLLVKRRLRNQATDKTDTGALAFILGVVGLGFLVAALLSPLTLIGALVFSIIAIVFGAKAHKKNKDDWMAKTGKLLGWITLGLLTAFAILVAIFVGNYD